MKKIIYWILFSITIALLVCFAGVTIYDYINYDPIVNSAPFDAFVLYRCVQFVAPAIVTFIASLILKKKIK